MSGFAEIAMAPTAIQIAGITAEFFVAASVISLAVAIVYVGCVMADWVRRHYRNNKH